MLSLGVLDPGQSSAAARGYGSGRCLVPGQSGCQAQTLTRTGRASSSRCRPRTPPAPRCVIRGARHRLVGRRHRLPGRGARHRLVGHCGGSCDPFAALRRTASGRARLDLGRRVPSRERHRAVRRSPALPCQRRSAKRAGGVRRSAGACREQLETWSMPEGPGAAPDVIMVVRTVDTSRWVAR